MLILTQAAQVERTHMVRSEFEINAQRTVAPRRCAPAVTHCHMRRAGVTAAFASALPDLTYKPML